MDIDRLHKISLTEYVSAQSETSLKDFKPIGAVATLPQRNPGIALAALEDLLKNVFEIILKGKTMAFDTEIHSVRGYFGTRYYATAEAYLQTKG